MKGGGGEGTTKLTIQRSNSTTSRKSRGEGGSSKASSSRGRVKSQSGIIEVIPPDQVQKANPSGNIYAAEVLKRAKAESQRHVREIIARGGLALEVTENESCHICRKGKSSGLRFHCGSHAFCDMHCAVRCVAWLCDVFIVWLRCHHSVVSQNTKSQCSFSDFLYSIVSVAEYTTLTRRTPRTSSLTTAPAVLSPARVAGAVGSSIASQKYWR